MLQKSIKRKKYNRRNGREISNEDSLNKRKELDIKAVESRLLELKDFRKLAGYQKALEFYTKLYVILSKLPFHEQYGVFSQLDRSSMSIVANLSEGNGSLYPKTKMNFYSIAFATTNETQCWLDIMVIKGYLNQEQHMELDEILESIKKLIICYIKPELFIKLYETCFAWLVKLFLTNSKLHLLSEKI